MIFDDVKVGDKFHDKQWNEVIEVTEITEKGFAYKVESPQRHLYPARYGPSLHTGGELYVKTIQEMGNMDYYEKNFERLLV